MSERPHTIGDAPIESRYFELMQILAGVLDEQFNPGFHARLGQRTTGFVLLVFPFNTVHPGARCNYISNAERKDVVTMLKEQIAYFEGMPSGGKGRG